MSGGQTFDPLWAVIFAALFSLILFFAGLAVYRYKCYGLIAGYNREPEDVKRQYDIKGLAKHVGQGLMTLSVLMMISAVFFYFGWYGWFVASISAFILVAFIIPLGAPRFMPEQQRLEKEGSPDAKHPVLRRILPASSYRSLEAKTRKWIQVCKKCGHKHDFWEAGGVRGGGVGEPLKLQYCQSCKTLRMHKIRKKTEEELANT